MFSNQIHPTNNNPTAAVYRWMQQHYRQHPDAESLAEAAAIELECDRELAARLAAEVSTLNNSREAERIKRCKLRK